MKTLYTSALLLTATLLPVGASARQLTPAEALGRVTPDTPQTGKLRAKVNPTPVMEVKATSSPSFTGLYIFDSGADGYLVVSADDCSVPLLGYSDGKDLDINNIPPQLNYWLHFYADEIEWAATHQSTGSRRVAARPQRAAIAPMTVSKWNQGAPYNDDCPMDGSARSVTGCVATAMAQAMYFHKWPAQGTGSHSYKWNDTELSVDFATTTYDWDAMTPTYDSSSSDAAKAAVANLMYSCGVSVDMDYSSDESGASSLTMGTALYKYFGYDKSMVQPQRYYYGLIDWENLVYDQLSQGLPVLYGGQSYEGGHQFICDGYSSDGYFHFNWGWGGMSDGYFLLSALDPMNQGIGGSADESGFNFDQGILLNMKPAQADSQITPLIYCYGNFAAKSTSAVTLGSTAEFKCDNGFLNFGVAEVKGRLGAKVVASDGTTTYLEGSDLSFPAITGYASFGVRLPSDLASGTYTVTPAFKMDGATEWNEVLCPLSGVQALTMTVSGGEATFADYMPASVEVTSLDFNTPIYLDKDFESSITFTNNGTEEYFGEFSYYLFDSNGNQVGQSADLAAVDVMPGETATIDYVSDFPSKYTTDSGTQTLAPGSYYLAVYSHFTNQQLYVASQPVTVQTAPATTQISITSLSVGATEPEDNDFDVHFTGSAQCEEGYFSGQLTVAVFREGSGSTTMEGKTNFIFMAEGESDNFEAHVKVTDVKVPESFFAVVFYDGKQMSDSYPFTITSTESVKVGNEGSLKVNNLGNTITVTSDLPITSVMIYTADGELVREAAPHNNEATLSADGLTGTFIVVAADRSGAKIVRHYIAE